MDRVFEVGARVVDIYGGCGVVLEVTSDSDGPQMVSIRFDNGFRFGFLTHNGHHDEVRPMNALELLSEV